MTAGDVSAHGLSADIDRRYSKNRMINIRENYLRILERIQAAAARSGRSPEAIQLIAVTKTVPASRIRQAVEAGIRNVGENRLQEALPKREELRDLPVTWHFIGHLQTNKARKVVENFDWVQCVDRPELADKINQASTKRLRVLIEVNLGGELSKSGIHPDGLEPFVESFKLYGQLDLRGLMTIPPLFENPELVRPYFRDLRHLAERFGLRELSMGMSHDFEVAIEEGATMVRIGTSLFGERI